jgi:hypothetical protein
MSCAISEYYEFFARRFFEAAIIPVTIVFVFLPALFLGNRMIIPTFLASGAIV